MGSAHIPLNFYFRSSDRQQLVEFDCDINPSNRQRDSMDGNSPWAPISVHALLQRSSRIAVSRQNECSSNFRKQLATRRWRARPFLETGSGFILLGSSDSGMRADRVNGFGGVARRKQGQKRSASIVSLGAVARGVAVFDRNGAHHDIRCNTG